MVNTSNFTVQQGSTVAFEQALHLGDKEDSHWVMGELHTLSFSSLLCHLTELPLIAPLPPPPPQKKRQLCTIARDEF